MKKIFFPVIILFYMTLSASAQVFDIQGHRGCRGLYPENSIPAFKNALDIGVKTLELDVVISKDGKVVVSHEPYFNSEICLGPAGNRFSEDSEETLNIYLMDYEEIKKYDCGSLGNPNFPGQKKMSVHKPLLKEVIEICDKYAEEKGRPLPDYNIEIKSQEDHYNKFQPEPAKFSDIVHTEIEELLPVTRVVIQSFDPNVLRYWKIKYPVYKLALLEERYNSPEKSIENLGFDPYIYSPYYKKINQKEIRWLYDREIKVIPWTVNDQKDMKKLVEWGVDGLITDYPDRFKEIFPHKMVQ